MNDAQIIRTGIDIVEVDRIRHAALRWHRAFLDRVFTARELAEASKRGSPYQFLAARFAAKEAVRKALGGGGAWTSIEVRHAPSGAPCVELHGDARAIQERERIRHIAVSLSHTATHAVASALLIGQGTRSS